LGPWYDRKDDGNYIVKEASQKLKSCGEQRLIKSKRVVEQKWLLKSKRVMEEKWLFKSKTNMEEKWLRLQISGGECYCIVERYCYCIVLALTMCSGTANNRTTPVKKSGSTSDRRFAHQQ